MKQPAAMVENRVKRKHDLKNKPLALVIEDDESHANVFSEALQNAGFKVEIIQDGKAALSRLTLTEPSVAVLDINLPYVSGVDILHYIRSDVRLTNTRVIIASANSQIAATLQDQADLVLIKPISYFQLRDLATRFRDNGSVSI